MNVSSGPFTRFVQQYRTLFFPFQKKKEKKNSHSLSIFVSNNFFAWNEDYPKIDWKGILIWFRKYKKKTQVSTFTYSFHEIIVMIRFCMIIKWKMWLAMLFKIITARGFNLGRPTSNSRLMIKFSGYLVARISRNYDKRFLLIN